MLRSCLANLGHPTDEDDMDSYLGYLEERGYVKVKKPTKEIVLVRITANGLDVLDGRKDDPGVGIKL